MRSTVTTRQAAPPSSLKEATDRILAAHPNLHGADILAHGGPNGIESISGTPRGSARYASLVATLKQRLKEERGFESRSLRSLGIQVLTADGQTIEGGKRIRRGLRTVNRGGEMIDSVKSSELTVPMRPFSKAMRKSLRALGAPFSEDSMSVWTPAVTTLDEEKHESAKAPKLKAVPTAKRLRRG